MELKQGHHGPAPNCHVQFSMSNEQFLLRLIWTEFQDQIPYKRGGLCCFLTVMNKKLIMKGISG